MARRTSSALIISGLPFSTIMGRPPSGFGFQSISCTFTPVPKPSNPGIVENGEFRFDIDNRRLYIQGREINLTAKEFDILELLVTHPGKVYSRDQLKELVWGKEYSGDARTVDVHVRRLREKVEETPGAPKYVQTKWGVGYFYKG